MFAAAPILIADDNVYIALDLTIAVEEMDGRVVGPVGSVDEALWLLASTAISAAAVDCELSQRDAAPLMRQLSERHIPYVIHTASAHGGTLTRAHPGIPVLTKPQQAETVLNCLLDEIRKAEPGQPLQTVLLT